MDLSPQEYKIQYIVNKVLEKLPDSPNNDFEITPVFIQQVADKIPDQEIKITDELIAQIVSQIPTLPVSNGVKTLNTISDLRQNRSPQNEEVIKVLAHNTKGLKQRYGGGDFEFVSEALFTLESINVRDDFAFLVTTPLTQALGADVSYGQKITFRDSGETCYLIRNAAISKKEYFQRVYSEGSTTFRVIGLTNKTKSGDVAYFADDDGQYIRPNYEGFDGIGYWKRILSDRQVITPEMFGVIPNKTIYEKKNECSGAMQKAFDSFLPLEGFGKYYITNTLKGKVKKPYIFNGYDLMYDVEVDRRMRAVDIGSKACFYTDKNIELVNLLADCDFRAVFDTSQATLHSDYAMTMPLMFRHRSNVDIVVHGNIKEIEENPGPTGTKCFAFDGLNKEYENIEFAGNGYVTSSNIKVKGVGVHTLVEHTKIAENLGSGIFTNTCNITVEGIYVKRGVWCDFSLSGTAFHGVIQSKAGCSAYTPEERNQPGFKDFCNKIDSPNGIYGIQVWDYRGNDNTFTDPCWLVSGPCDLAFNTKRDIYRPTKGEHFIRNEVSLIAPTQYSPSYGFIDRDSSLSKFHLITALNSVWVSFIERGNVTMNAYKAPSNFNFEDAVNTADSYPEINETNDIKIENAENFGTISKLPPTFKWSDSADVENDFIEIVLTDPKNTGILSIRELALALDGTCKYLQLIQGNRTFGFIDAKDLDFHHFRFLKSLNREVIIRLIGKGDNPRNKSDENGIIKLADICALSIDNKELGRDRSYSPVLTTEGGQPIYDDMIFEKGAPIIKKNGDYYRLEMDDNMNPIFTKI